MDIAEKLNQLKKMKESGAISEQEYNRLRQKALDAHMAERSAAANAVPGDDEETGKLPVAAAPAVDPFEVEPTMTPFAEAPVASTPTPAQYAADPAVPRAYADAPASARKPFNKKILIGIAAAVLVLVGVLVFAKGGGAGGGLSADLKRIQGNYDMYYAIADGTEIDTASIGATGSLEIDGENFHMTMSTGLDASGTIAFKEEQTVSSGTTYYIYTLTGSDSGGGSVSAAYTEDDATMIVFTSDSIDADNNFWFKKK